MAQLLVYAHCEFARAARRDYAFPLVFSVSNSKALSTIRTYRVLWQTGLSQRQHLCEKPELNFHTDTQLGAVEPGDAEGGPIIEPVPL